MFNIVAIISIRIVTICAKEMATLEVSRTVANSIFNIGKRIYSATTSSSLSQASHSPIMDESSNESNNEQHLQQHRDLKVHKSEQNLAATSLLCSISSSMKFLSRAHHATECQNDTSTEYLVHNWLEDLFARFQMIAIWHDPMASAYAICGLLSTYMLLTYFAPRLYAIVLIAIFIQKATKLWFRHIWPEIRVPPSAMDEAAARADINRYTILHPNLMTLEEFRDELSQFVKFCDQFIVARLLLLRQEKPIIFCSIVCSLLYMLANIGNRMTGFTLLFGTLILICVVAGIYIHLLPQDLKRRLRILSLQIKKKIQNIDRIEVDKANFNNDRQTIPKNGGNLSSSTTSNIESLIAVESEDVNQSLPKQPEQQQSWYLESYMNIAQQPLLSLFGILRSETASNNGSDDGSRIADHTVTKDETTKSEDESMTVRKRLANNSSNSNLRKTSDDLGLDMITLIESDADEEDKDGFVIL